MRALLLSAYDAVSHRRWREALVEAIDADWTVLVQPARHFSWRMRGNPLTWWGTSPEVLERDYDVLVATSMVDLATLRGLFPRLARARTCVYFHENQLVYPSRHGRPDAEWALHHVFNGLVADRVGFNSRYNLETCWDGTEALLRRLPDGVPEGTVDTLRARSEVLSVPIAGRWCPDAEVQREGALRILWNHRWEYDKAPERFFAALRRLVDRGVHFRVEVVGQRFREAPAVFAEAKEWLGDRLGAFGWLESGDAYRRLLQRCDVVVSTALHEFQGLSVLEAMACGCHPLVPDRLAYPEFVPMEGRYGGDLDDAETDVRALANALERLARSPRRLRNLPRPDVSAVRWERLEGRYRSWIGQ